MSENDAKSVLASLRPGKGALALEGILAVVAMALAANLLFCFERTAGINLGAWFCLTAIGAAAAGRLSVLLRLRRKIGKYSKQDGETKDQPG